MALPAGARLDQYEIRSLLGSGGMGDVYLARDLTLNRDVALKILPARFANDPDRLRRFAQEARSASALNHPAIVAIYEQGQAGGQPYISMELVDGQTVRQLLNGAAIPPRRALHVAAQVADALAKAHEAGLVHRDLKPENLMVSADGYAKILDFGLAKLVDSGADQASLPTVTSDGTRAGSVLGTVGYMSPEQASGQPADLRSDQFSFGLVLYELLTHRRAFVRATAAETLSAIIREEPPPVDQQNPSVPPPLRWIVERCLAKEPGERYASTRDLARDLATARDHYAELTASTSAAAPRTTARLREVLAWVTAAILGAAALGLALRYNARATPEPARPVRLTIEPPPGGTFHLTVGAAPFALSSDGHQLAFVGGADGSRQLWLRSFDSPESRPLAGTDGAAGPFWSPDGLSIAFFAEGKLKRISASGGDIGTICEARGGGGGGTWNRDGVIVFAPSIDVALYRVPADGGTPTPVTALDAAHDEAGHLSPMFLPDGRHFLFFVMGRDNTGVHVGSLEGAERRMLLPSQSTIAFSELGYVFFVRDHALVAYRLDLAGLAIVGDPVRVAEGVAVAGPTAAMAVSANGSVVYWSGGQNITQLTWMRRDGTTAGAVGPPGGFMNIALSPDGRQVAVDRFDTQPSIWLIDIARGAATRATFGPLYESTPVWRPDGLAFVFAAALEAPPNVFLKRLDVTAEDQRLFRSTIQCFPQSWSHDGKTIAYLTIDPKTRHDIWLLPASGGDPSPFLRTPFIESYPRISPDGRWLAYVSNDTGRNAVYVTRFPVQAGKWPVSTAGGSFPVWRADSRELYYRGSDGRLMAVSVGGGSDFEAGVPSPLFTPNATPGTLGLGTFYDVAADGRFLVNLNVERRSPPANVVLNWAPAAGRR